MTWIVLLFALGVLFIAVEVIVPGAILGSIGGLLMFTGIVLSFVEFGFGGGMIAVAAALGVAGLALYLEFRVLPKTRIGRRAFLTREISEVSNPSSRLLPELIGKTAEAITLLSPSGLVRIDGGNYEAFCQTGQVPAGTALEVIGADTFRLIVTPRH
jgi:membrane-bound ClpP family serine protease